MSIITLTSDFGSKDHRVAIIKGSLFFHNPEVKFVDITHEIDSYNLLQTSYIIKNAYRHFPKNSVHLIAVDSFYSKQRKYLLYKADQHYFMAADNGVLSLIFFDIKPEAIYEITLNNRFDDEVQFAPTDILVPVAIHLQNGGLPELIGRKIDNVKELLFPKAISSSNKLVGEVLYIDHFGNVVTNIDRKSIEEKLKNHPYFEIRFRNTTLTKIHEQYTDIVSDWEKENLFHGKSLALYNSINLLEIAIYKGVKTNGANNLLGLKIGDQILIEFREKE